MDTVVTAIGFAAAAGTTSAWFPQVLKTWRTGKADDFSWSYLAVFTAGVTLWLIYGIAKKDAAIIASNCATILLVVSIVFVKWRH